MERHILMYKSKNSHEFLLTVKMHQFATKPFLEIFIDICVADTVAHWNTININLQFYNFIWTAICDILNPPKSVLNNNNVKTASSMHILKQ